MAIGVTAHGLRRYAGCGGCAAKLPAEAVELLARIAADQGASAAEVLVGLDPSDDAAIYALDETRALIATVDFFPPLVDAPDDYGAIAAANAVSDVYAMGGSVAFALALSGFPAELPIEVVAEVARSAAVVVRECGGMVLGGHSIRCAEPVFGLCVLGFAERNRIWRKAGAQPGDVLVLSKPLGTGLLLSSRDATHEAIAVASMRGTNRAAADALRRLPEPPHAVTDVSGFGLLGHLGEICARSGVRAVLDSTALPLLPGALAAAAAGIRTTAHRQQSARVPVHLGPAVSREMAALLADPQTSGGLLAAVPQAAVGSLLDAGYARIGWFETGAAVVAVR